MKKLLALLLAGLVSSPFAFSAVTAYSPPVGGVTINGAANTDNIVSVPLARSPVWVGLIGSVSGPTLTASGSPNWTSNAFTTPSIHYVRVLSGVLKGHYFAIAANTANTVTVDAAGLNLSSIEADAKVEIAPFWTLGTLFPPSAAGASFIASTSSLSRQTELLFYDATATGINRAASAIYYYFNGAWRKAGSSVATSFNNTIIFPDSYFLQRNKAATTKLLLTGKVQTGSIGTIVEATVAQNDNYIALSFPRNVTLDELGLAGPAFSTSPSSLNVTDQLLLFDSAGTGINRSASAIYYYFNNGWRKRGSSVGTNFGSSVVIPAGSGFVIRKVANGTSGQWIFNTGL